MLIEHVGPFHASEHLFREGDPFEAIAAVRAAKRFQEDGVLRVDRRELEIVQRESLEALAGPVLRD